MTRRSSPPHNLDAERSVLGAVLLDERHLDVLMVESGVLPEHFYEPKLARIYAAMLELSRRGQRVDHLTVAEQLRERRELEEIGGPSAVEEVTAWVPVSGNIREYARIVREAAQLRALQRAAWQILASIDAREVSVAGILDAAGQAILAVTQEAQSRRVTELADALNAEIDLIQIRSESDTALTGTPSGFRDLDAVTGGFQPGALTVLAARPGMGKSALVANIAAHAGLRGHGVVLFSLEMSEAELSQRLLAAEAGVPGEQLRRGPVKEREWTKILDASNRLSVTRVFLDDSGDTSLLDVRAKARRLHQGPQGPLGLVVVDYLQLMQTDERAGNRVEAVGQLSRGLKSLAKELEVPVIALSQLSRAVEGRADRRPMISDLRESGQIEADADLIMFIYRDEVYDPESAHPGEAELIIAKNRSGPLQTVTLTFQGKYPRFMSYAGPFPGQP